MDVIKFCSDSWLDYPVGNSIDKAIEIVDDMVPFLINEIGAYALDERSTIQLWARGSSGAILSALIADRLRLVLDYHVTIVYVKKPGEHRHEMHEPRPCPALAFLVDDFIDTGETVYEILDHARDEHDIDMDGIVLCGSVNTKSVEKVLEDEYDISFLIKQE